MTKGRGNPAFCFLNDVTLEGPWPELRPTLPMGGRICKVPTADLLCTALRWTSPS